MPSINVIIITLVLILFSSIILPSALIFCQTPPKCAGRQGQWELLHSSLGISAMHMQLLHNNKVIMFDRTDFGSSNLSLPNGRCRRDTNDTALKVDCTAHSILYDIDTNTFRALMVHTDTWCSSGAVLPDGTLIQTGGYNDGDHVIRSFTPCTDENCDWIEFPHYLTERRWYATNQILPDGRIIIVGGRRQFNYEFYPRLQEDSSPSPGTFRFHFLVETTDQYENNLYPFLNLLPSGNLFIFANTRSVLFDYKQNRVVKEFPQIPGGDPRNYPSSGSSVLLPLDENEGNVVEILLCGGAPRDGFSHASRRSFARALSSCGRLNVSQEDPNWVMEDMPMARVMNDMLLLPTGDVLIINGAELGTAGWENGADPAKAPIVYRPSEASNWRFSVMNSSQRPRLYHSSAVLLPDGRVLVGGSNPHVYYNFTGVEFPTDLSLEAFSPPYLAAGYTPVRPTILTSLNEVLGYGDNFSVKFTVPDYLTDKVLSVRIIAPSFTTHSFSMNQRMVVLKLMEVCRLTSDTYDVTVMGPSTAEIAPPGYYMLFVVHAGIPSSGTWVKVQSLAEEGV
ncbi:aldehyde oxidase GLOX [Carya illinoinensis]|uniref:Galactose oxidase n=1 Tax=Carya illinoinensis TaxID=32201 RepID=A0A8T1PX87_CARIL|nr:aldehyde oxidase GLOX [Carya illinoinensis]KAG6646424.1 hypothetical protein CIPAW_07G008000 [Carya illinoinensis]